MTRKAKRRADQIQRKATKRFKRSAQALTAFVEATVPEPPDFIKVAIRGTVNCSVAVEWSGRPTEYWHVNNAGAWNRVSPMSRADYHLTVTVSV